MSKTLLGQEPVRVETEPLTFEANSSMRLDVDGEGFTLTKKKGKVFSSVRWADLRELKSQVRDKGSFTYWGVFNVAPMGENKGRVGVKVKGDKEAREKLAAVFDKLPPEVYGKQCPECLGPVVEGTCKYCGKSFRAQQRKRGIVQLLIGVAMVTLGVILTNAYSTGGKTTVYIGLLLIGAVTALVGLIGILFGVRT